MPLQGSTSIERMCQLAQVSRAGFYRFLQEKTPADEVDGRDELLGNVASQRRHAAHLNAQANAQCESFIKTLKREEIYANAYENLEHLRANIEIFIEQYYNQLRLHSALGYRSPEEFERQAQCQSEAADAKAATITFVVGWAQSSTRMLEQGLKRLSSSLPPLQRRSPPARLRGRGRSSN